MYEVFKKNDIYFTTCSCINKHSKFKVLCFYNIKGIGNCKLFKWTC